MGDLDRNTQASSVIRITGSDELYSADVVLDNDQRKLLVKSSNEISSDLVITQVVNANINLPTGSYYTITSLTGRKTVSGFQLKFDKTEVFVKLEIDGITIFDLDMDGLRDFIDWHIAPQPSTYVSINNAKRTFYFTPRFPIISESSITISARTTSNAKYISSVVQVG